METTITRIGIVSKIEAVTISSTKIEVTFCDNNGYLIIVLQPDELGEPLALRQAVEVSFTVNNRE